MSPKHLLISKEENNFATLVSCQVANLIFPLISHHPLRAALATMESSQELSEATPEPKSNYSETMAKPEIVDPLKTITGLGTISVATAEAFPGKPEEHTRSQSPSQNDRSASLVSTIGADWLSRPVFPSQESVTPAPAASPISLGQEFMEKPSETLTTPVFCEIKRKTPEEYEKDRVGKYAQYFQGNTILPMPEMEALKPRILSLVISDLKTRKLAGLRREDFGELLRINDIPCCRFCRRSFATWDILLPTEEQAEKLVGSNIKTKFFRVQFKEIQEKINFRERKMVVEDRRPHCWSCQQVGHLAKSCPQKTPKPLEKQTNTAPESGDPPNKGKGSTLVTRKNGKDIPQKSEAPYEAPSSNPASKAKQNKKPSPPAPEVSFSSPKKSKRKKKTQRSQGNESHKI